MLEVSHAFITDDHRAFLRVTSTAKSGDGPPDPAAPPPPPTPPTPSPPVRETPTIEYHWHVALSTRQGIGSTAQHDRKQGLVATYSASLTAAIEALRGLYRAHNVAESDLDAFLAELAK